MHDIALIPDPDGFTYRLGAPTADAAQRIAARFTTQFLSAFNSATQRGAMFMSMLAGGNVRTNADLVGLVTMAAAQVSAAERALAYDVTLLSTELIDAEFVGDSTIRVAVRLNSSESSSVSTILVTT